MVGIRQGLVSAFVMLRVGVSHVASRLRLRL